MAKQNQMRTVSMVIVITLIGKVMGLGRDVLMGSAFGTGMEADALTAATQVPRIFFDTVFASAISSSFIPVFNEYMERRGRDEAFNLAGSFLTIVGIAAALMSLLGMAFSGQLVGVMTEYTGETAALTTSLLRIIFPTVFFTGVAFTLVGILQSMGEFNIPAAMSIFSNGVLIIYYLFLSGRYGVHGAAVALLIGWALQAIIQVPSLVKRGYRYRPGLRHEGLRKIFMLMLPVMVSTWIQPINQLVVTRFASRMESWAAAVGYANTIYIMVASIFVLSLTNVMFPEMSRLSVTGDKRAFSDVINQTSRTVLFLLIPMTVGMMLLSTPIIRLFYERGEFTAQSTATTSTVLFYISIGMVGYGIQNVLARAFYATGNGRVPMISGICSIATNLILCILLVDRMGVGGLALASGIASLVAAAILLVPTHQLTGDFLTRGLLVAVLKMVVSAAAMGAVVFLLRGLLEGALGGGTLGQIVLIGVPTLAGVIVYMVAAQILRIEEAGAVFGLLGKLRKGDR